MKKLIEIICKNSVKSRKKAINKLRKEENMTIYEIKRRVTNAPHFFDRASMRFFGQTLKSFRVLKIGPSLYELAAPMRDSSGRCVGMTRRIFDARINRFVREESRP